MKYKKLFGEKKPILMISKGEYSDCYFEDGERILLSYTQKEINRRFGIALKMVKRGVYVDEKEVEKTEKGIKIMNKEFNFSRRMAKAWACLLLITLPFLSFSQNTAPVAVNDTLHLCNDEINYFSVITNDTDANGDRLKLNYFSDAIFGNLVSASNTGMFRHEFDTLGTTDTFEYNVKDLRFANIGSLTSNTAYVELNGRPKYYYTGTYTGTTIRETCLSINTGAVTISGTTIEENTAFKSITLDGSIGVVEIAPTAGGSVLFKIF